MHTGCITTWSERGGPSPRRSRLAHPVKQEAETGRKHTPGGSAKVTLRGHGQYGTTRIGKTKM